MTWLLAARALPWKLIGFAALALMVGSLMLALKIERTQNGKLKAQIELQAAELKRISTKRDEQKVITHGRIVIADKGRKQAEDKAKVIEAAPLVPGCKTPPEIMGADL